MIDLADHFDVEKIKESQSLVELIQRDDIRVTDPFGRLMSNVAYSAPNWGDAHTSMCCKVKLESK